MLVLNLNRTLFKWLDLMETEKSFSIQKYVKIICVVFIELFLVIPAIAYFLENTTNLRNMIESMYGIMSFGTSFGMYCIFLGSRPALNRLFAELQDIVDSRTEGNQFQNYETTEKRISKFTKVFTITTFAICSIVLLRPFYTSLIMVLFGTFDPQNVSIPFRATYPFNQTVPPGLFISAAIEIAAGYKFCAVFCAISTFYIGITWYIETCVNEIPTIYKKINKFLNSASRRYINSTAGRYFLKKHLLEIVQFHWKILCFVENFADLMNAVIFITFSNGIIWLSASFAQFLEFSIKLFQPALSSILVLVWLYIYCAFGNLVSVKCEEISQFAYNAHFYKYPIDLNIFTLMTINQAQRPFFITGFKMTRCSLDSYKRLINTSVSFYMLFRNLTMHQ